MNTQKNFFNWLPVVLLTLIFGLSACTDECDNIDCGPNSVGCEDGICICELGYFGSNCENFDSTFVNPIDTTLTACDTLECGDNGVLVTPTGDEDCFCECAEGYEGEDCEVTSRDKFLGTFNATSTCDDESFIVTIDFTSNNPSSIRINNFSNLVNPTTGGDFNIPANVSGNTITLFATLDGITVNGTGMLTEAENIVLSYTLTDENGNTQNCEDTLIRI